MKIINFFRTVLRGFDSATKVLPWIGYISLVGMALVIFTDVMGRYLLRKPLLGSVEIIELAMVTLGSFAVLHTTIQRGHVTVDLLLTRFSRRAQVVINKVGLLLGFVTLSVISYGVYLEGILRLKFSDETDFLNIKTGPFELVLALALFISSLTWLIQAFRPAASEKKPEEKERRESGI